MVCDATMQPSNPHSVTDQNRYLTEKKEPFSADTVKSIDSPMKSSKRSYTLMNTKSEQLDQSPLLRENTALKLDLNDINSNYALSKASLGAKYKPEAPEN